MSDAAIPVVAALPVPLSPEGEALPAKRGPGRPPGKRNNNPKLDEALRGKGAVKARRLVNNIIAGKKIRHHGKWWEPTEYQRMAAARMAIESYDRLLSKPSLLGDMALAPAAIINIQI